jgi:hypothetical protein
MIEVDCSELTQEEQRALAASISDELQGESLALVKGSSIVIDRISGPKLDVAQLVHRTRAQPSCVQRVRQRNQALGLTCSCAHNVF